MIARVADLSVWKTLSEIEVIIPSSHTRGPRQILKLLPKGRDHITIHNIQLDCSGVGQHVMIRG